MDKQVYNLRTFIDDKGDFYAGGRFSDSRKKHGFTFENGGPDFSFVEQKKTDIIQIGQSNLSVFLIDKNHDLWIVGYFKYFPYIRENISVSNRENKSRQYRDGLVTRPSKIKLGFHVADVVTFSTWVFLLDTEGNIWKSGSNVYPATDSTFKSDCPGGEVLNKRFDDLIKISSDPIFKSISCGKYHLIAIDHSGNLWGYGEIPSQVLDFGQSGFFRQPTTQLMQITEDIPFNSVMCGKFSTCALDNQGCLYACGLCSYSEDDLERKSILPVNIAYCQFHNFEDIEYYSTDYNTHHLPHLTMIESNIRFKHLSIGQNRSLFVDVDGKLWGCGSIKMLGLPKILGSKDVFLTAINLGEDVRIKSVWCQNDSSYALSDDGILFGCSYYLDPQYEFTRNLEIYDSAHKDQPNNTRILMLPNEKYKPKGSNTKSARNKA